MVSAASLALTFSIYEWRRG